MSYNPLFLDHNIEHERLSRGGVWVYLATPIRVLASGSLAAGGRSTITITSLPADVQVIDYNLTATMAAGGLFDVYCPDRSGGDLARHVAPVASQQTYSGRVRLNASGQFSIWSNVASSNIFVDVYGYMLGGGYNG